MSRSCSQCGNNGHNSRTCGDGGGENGIMLFGVRVVEGATSFRKSVSMNNLSQYDQPLETVYGEVPADGYESDDVVHASGRSRERKRGVPWTEEEHKLFLMGLQKVGKGDWRGISRNFVKTRTPTQVASHAQKYFLRRSNQSRRRRRSSLFDITTDNVMNSSSMEEGQLTPHPEPTKLPVHLSSNVAGFSTPAFPTPLIPNLLPTASVASDDYSIEKLTLGPANQVATAHKSSPKKLIHPVPIIPAPPSSKMAKLNLNQSISSEDSLLPLSLKLSTPSSQDQQSPASTTSHSSAFETISSGDSRISVA